MDGAALPTLDALLARLVETNRAAEELARQVLPAIKDVLERYVRHVLPQEMSAVQSKSFIRRRGGGDGGGGSGGVGPLESSLNYHNRRASLSPPPRGGFGDGLGTERRGRGAQRGRKMDSDSVVAGQAGQGLGGPSAASVAELIGAGLGEGVDLEVEITRLTDCIGKLPSHRSPALHPFRYSFPCFLEPQNFVTYSADVKYSAQASTF